MSESAYILRAKWMTMMGFTDDEVVDSWAIEPVAFEEELRNYKAAIAIQRLNSRLRPLSEEELDRIAADAQEAVAGLDDEE